MIYCDEFDSDYLSAWKTFAEVVPTEKHAVEIVYSILYRDKPLRCFYCNSVGHSRPFGSRFAKCMACLKITWITSGTFFHKAKFLRPILAAFWLLESRVYINPFRFHKLLEIGYAAAILIFKKISLAINNQVDESLVSIPSSEFHEVICRRSRQTRALEHPISEIQDSYDCMLSASDDCADSDECDDTSVIDSFTKQERDIYEVLSDQPQNVNVICFKTGIPASQVSASLVMLELSDLVQLMPGECYKRKDLSTQQSFQNGCLDPFEFTDSRAPEVLQFIDQRFRGVSRKYLQAYACLHWFYSDLICWHPGRLIEVCKAYGRISGRQVSSYLSPYQISAFLNGL